MRSLLFAALLLVTLPAPRALAGVGQDGSFTQRVPIAIPLGTGGVHPALALGWHASNGDTLAGAGWTLEGLPQVVRTRHGGGLTLTTADGFRSPEGQLLPTGVAGQYRAQTDDFALWTAVGTCGQGPCSFRQQDRNGWTWEYGGSATSRVTAQGSATVVAWGLSRVSNPRGLSWEAQYRVVNGHLWPAQLLYTHGAGGTLRSITFDYEPRPAQDRPTSWSLGTQQVLHQRLSRISVFAAPQALVRRYVLTYDAAETRRSLLASIEEVGANDSARLPALTYRYSPRRPPQFSQDRWGPEESLDTTVGASTAGWDGSEYQPTFADFDGDGRTDVLLQARFTITLGQVAHDARLWSSRAQAWVDLTRATAAERERWGYDRHALVPGDFNGDGHLDAMLLAINAGGDSYLMLGDGAGHFSPGALGGLPMARFSLVYARSGLGQGPAQRYPLVGDFDGDGAQDLLLRPGPAGEDCVVRWGNGTAALLDPGADPGAASRFIASLHLATAVDLDGDGITDLINQGLTTQDTQEWLRFDAQGHFTAQPLPDASNRWATQSVRATPLDVNGDGRTDLLLAPLTTGADGWLAHNTGRGFVLRPFAGIGGDWTALPGDFDGDGRDDVLLTDRGAHTQELLLSTGETLTSQGAHVHAAWDRLAAVDLDADGQLEIVTTRAAGVKVVRSSGARAHLLVEAGNGLGARQVITWGSSAHQPQAAVPAGEVRPDVSPRPVVISVTTHERSAASATSTWAWRNARLQRLPAPLPFEGRVAGLGFEEQETCDVETGQCVVTTYTQELPFAGRVKQVRSLDATGGLARRETTTALRNLACDVLGSSCTSGGVESHGRVVARPTELITETFEAGTLRLRRTRTMLGWDDWGNPTLVRDEVTTRTSTGTALVRRRFERTSYVNQASPTRAIGLPWLGRTCLDEACAQVLEAVRTTYDERPEGEAGAFLEATRVAKAAGTDWVTTRRAYDAWGNVVTETGPDGLELRVTYDPVFHRDRVRQEAPGEPWRAFTVDHRYGLVVSESDANGTALITTLDQHGRPATRRWYDSHGQLVRARTLSSSPGDAQHPAFAMVCEDAGEGQPQDACTTTFLDSLGRTTRVLTWNGTAQVAVETQYDAAGRAWRVSEPHPADSAATAWTTTTYDVAGRVQQVTHPNGSQTRYRYDGTLAGTAVSTETVIAPGGVLTTRQKDIDGHLVLVTEGEQADGVSLATRVTHEYDDHGRLVTTRSPGKVTTITWDDYGRRTSILDPDTGLTLFTWHGGAQGQANWGRLASVSRPDPNGGVARLVTSYTWDAQGRAKTEESSDGTRVTFEYDDPAVANSIGKLSRAVQESHGVTITQELAYDGLGNRSAVLRSVQGPGFAFAALEGQRFDRLGRLAELTYPDGSSATYRYHGVSRLLAAIALDGADVVRYGDYTARGQAGSVQYGNGVTATWDYEPASGRLDRARVTHAATSTALMDRDYRFEPRGNPAEVVDRVEPGRTRRFEYDAWQRLTRVREGACAGTEDCRVLDYEYDLAGNLLRKEGTTFTLAPGTQRVSSDGVDALAWSDSGNLLTRGAQAFAYDRRNMLHEVREGGALVQRNHHDQDGRRVLKERFQGTSTSRTFFAGRLSETQEVRMGQRLISAQVTRHVIGPDGAVVASVVKDAQALRTPFGALEHFRRDSAHPRSLPGLARAAWYGAAVALAEGRTLHALLGALLTTAAAALLLLGVRAARRTRRWGRQVVAVPTLLAFLATACGPQQRPPPVDPVEGFESALPAGTHFFHADHLGSVALVTGSDGTVTQRLHYLPWGDLDPTSSDDASASRRFTGQRFDPETRLYAFNARYYDPSLARFTTADTLVPDATTALGFHRYAFAKDNPIRYTDPSGHSWYSAAAGLMASAGKVVGQAIGDYFTGLGPQGCLLLGTAIVAAVLAPLTGGASLYLNIGMATGVGVYNGVQAGSPEMVIGALATGVSQSVGLPTGLQWSPQTGWAVSLTAPITGGDAWGLRAGVTWYQKGGVDASVTLGIKGMSVTAGWSSQRGAYAGGGYQLADAPVSVGANWSQHGGGAFGARYDAGAFVVDAGFRSDRGFYLATAATMSIHVSSNLGEGTVQTSVSASFDSHGGHLSGVAHHGQFETADSAGMTGLLINQAQQALKGEPLDFELL